MNILKKKRNWGAQIKMNGLPCKKRISNRNNNNDKRYYTLVSLSLLLIYILQYLNFSISMLKFITYTILALYFNLISLSKIYYSIYSYNLLIYDNNLKYKISFYNYKLKV